MLMPKFRYQTEDSHSSVPVEDKFRYQTEDGQSSVLVDDSLFQSADHSGNFRNADPHLLLPLRMKHIVGLNYSPPTDEILLGTSYADEERRAQDFTLPDEEFETTETYLCPGTRRSAIRRFAAERSRSAIRRLAAERSKEEPSPRQIVCRETVSDPKSNNDIMKELLMTSAEALRQDSTGPLQVW